MLTFRCQGCSPNPYRRACQLEAVCLVRNCQGLISLQVSENVPGCCHVKLGWLAHGSGPLVGGVGDVVSCALAQKHQGPRIVPFPWSLAMCRPADRENVPPLPPSCAPDCIPPCQIAPEWTWCNVPNRSLGFRPLDPRIFSRLGPAIRPPCPSLLTAPTAYV